MLTNKHVNVLKNKALIILIFSISSINAMEEQAIPASTENISNQRSTNNRNVFDLGCFPIQEDTSDMRQPPSLSKERLNHCTTYGIQLCLGGLPKTEKDCHALEAIHSLLFPYINSSPDYVAWVKWFHEIDAISTQLRAGLLLLCEDCPNFGNGIYTIDELVKFVDELQRINYSHYYLKTFPLPTLQFPALTTLILSHNNITSLPPLTSPSLEFLWLNNNKLTTLGTKHNLPSLKYLDVSENQITELPENIGNLSKLMLLILNFNNLSVVSSAAIMNLFKKYPSVRLVIAKKVEIADDISNSPAMSQRIDISDVKYATKGRHNRNNKQV